MHQAILFFQLFVFNWSQVHTTPPCSQVKAPKSDYYLWRLSSISILHTASKRRHFVSGTKFCQCHSVFVWFLRLLRRSLDCLGRLINLARGGTGNQCFHLLSTPLIAVFNCLNVFIHSHIFYKLYLRVASWTAFLNAASNAVIWILSLPPVDRRCLKISY